MNSSNLPSGSYDYIVIRCIDVASEIDNNDKCEKMKNIVKCTCNNLVAGTQYKIIFITRQKYWDDAIFQLPSNQKTSNSISLNSFLKIKKYFLLRLRP